MEYEFTDRYQATGRQYPKLLTACLAGCEGMGVYPCHDGKRREGQVWPMREPLTPYERREISRIVAEQGHEEPDGYYFIRCEACGGTGKCGKLETLRRIPWWIKKGISFIWHSRARGYCGKPALSLRARIRIAFRS